MEQLASGLQSRPGNEVDGLEGRAQLLIRLGQALSEKEEYFGENGRPGNMIGTCNFLPLYDVVFHLLLYVGIGIN